jgi:hypothetical protein
MTRPIRIAQHVATLALLAGAASLPALAGSSASSASSEGSSASSGSSSTSFEKSSQSSSGETKATAGDYRIIEMADAAARPDAVRLRLQPVAAGAGAEEFFLYVPRETAAASRLATGQTVTARDRAYGTEFAHGDTKQAFFLVLDDKWYQELATRPVTL